MDKTVTLTDLSKADNVEILYDETGKLWVNVDGKCLLRIGKVNAITLDDWVRGSDCIVPKSNTSL